MFDERFYISSGPLKLSSIIEGTNSFLLDDNCGDENIFSPAELGSSVKGQISFLCSKKYSSLVLSASASACFVTPELSNLIESQNIIPIISSEPKSHFSRSISKLVKLRKNRNLDSKSSISASSNIHKTAIISDGAVIESGVEISPFCVIGPGVHIKSNTFIGSHTIINCAVVGSGCYIKASSVIGGSGFGISSDEVGIINVPHVGRVIIGNDVFIGSNTCIDRGFIGQHYIRISNALNNLRWQAVWIDGPVHGQFIERCKIQLIWT